MTKRYNVCVPRKYLDKQGHEKTHFWQIGVMFPMKERDGFNIELYTRVLPTDKLCCFINNEDASKNRNATDENDPIPGDDIPF